MIFIINLSRKHLLSHRHYSTALHVLFHLINRSKERQCKAACPAPCLGAPEGKPVQEPAWPTPANSGAARGSQDGSDLSGEGLIPVHFQGFQRLGGRLGPQGARCSPQALLYELNNPPDTNRCPQATLHPCCWMPESRITATDPQTSHKQQGYL